MRTRFSSSLSSSDAAGSQARRNSSLVGSVHGSPKVFSQPLSTPPAATSSRAIEQIVKRMDILGLDSVALGKAEATAPS